MGNGQINFVVDNRKRWKFELPVKLMPILSLGHVEVQSRFAETRFAESSKST